MFKDLPGHQAQAFIEAEKYGAFAFLAVHFSTSGRKMVFPWRGALGDHYRAWCQGHAVASIGQECGSDMNESGWLDTVRRMQ